MQIEAAYYPCIELGSDLLQQDTGDCSVLLSVGELSAPVKADIHQPIGSLVPSSAVFSFSLR